MTTAAIETIVDTYAGWSALGLLSLLALILLWDRRHPRRSRFRWTGEPPAPPDYFSSPLRRPHPERRRQWRDCA